MKLVLLSGVQAGDFVLELEEERKGRSVLSLRCVGSDAVLEVMLSLPLVVPPALLVAEHGAMRLVSLAELRAKAMLEVEKASPSFDPLALEAQWLALVAAVSSASIDEQTVTSFLGMKPFPDGATELQGSVLLNLNACLVDRSARLGATIDVSASCAIVYIGQPLTLRCGWRLSVSADAAVPRLSIRLPGPHLRFPTFELPDFDLARLAMLAEPEFDMALPTLPGIALTLMHAGVSLSEVVYNSNTGALRCIVKVEDARLCVYDVECSLGSPELSFDNGSVTIDKVEAGPFTLAWAAQPESPVPAPLDGVVMHLGAGELAFGFDVDQGPDALKGFLRVALTLSAAAQPDKSLTIRLTLPFLGTSFTDIVTVDGKEAKRAVVTEHAGGSIEWNALLGNVSALGSISLGLSAPALASPQLDVLVDVLSAILAGVAGGVAGLARIVETGLRALFDLLRKAAVATAGLDLRLVLDARTCHLQQVLVGLRRDAVGTEVLIDVPSLSLTAPAGVDLALLIDLRDGARDAYLVTTVASADGRLVELGSDLWFDAPAREMQSGSLVAPGDHAAGTPKKKLIEVKVSAKAEAGVARLSFVPFGIRHGEALFFHALETPLPVLSAAPAADFTGYRLRPDPGQSIAATVAFDIDGARQRFLPFLAAPGQEPRTDPDGLGKMLKQYIELASVSGGSFENGVFHNDATVKLHVMGNTITSTVKLQLDARRMTASVKGGLIKLSLKDGEPLELLGMKASFVPASDAAPAPQGEQFVLDLGSGDARMYLNDAYKMVLDFDRLGKDARGRPLRFEVVRLVVHGAGMDLEAALAGPYTIRLNGLETDFTFEQARIQVRGGRIESFSLGALGKLPPALVGDVDVRLQLDFGQRKDGSVGLINGAIELKNGGKPIRSEQTHFVLTLDALSVRIFDDGGGLHFCAFVSGGAKFAPEAPALADGMLKNLAGVELSFTDCPVCGASDVIERELERLNLSFVVALDEPVRASLFELFSLEVRSIGFEPRCKAFEHRPAAIVIGGQVMFAASGDVVRAECDFHKLYLATPAPGSILPRLKCEGLGVGLKLGSAIEIEGKVVAVDGRMPEVLVSTAPPGKISGNGFMGQGRIAIQGLPPFAASFGFVEIAIPREGEPGQVDRKLAWFVYLEAERLSYHFQLGPVPFFLREAGLGLGYHFTYVGVEAIDNAANVVEMVKAVDTIAATALEPARLENWTASRTGDPTLVARMFISMSSASAPAEPLVWKESEEENLPNVMLLNVVAAMRKSTFGMTANVWLGHNYRDWDKARKLGANELAGKQTMTGYVLLAGARSEFLARVKSNRGVEIGKRLMMPAEFTAALKEIDYEATLYIRPGLMHFELGWPNRIRWSTNVAGVRLSVAGGAIFRVHEGAVLAGLNLEGNLAFSMSARLDAGCVGVAVSASVSAALVARIIGYLDSRDVAQSMYYSLFSLQISVKFEVSAWLEIDAWLCKITIRVSFALSLQIDVVAELALQGDAQMGTRVRATIAVSMFGRSLGLSVGLAVKPGLVDSAAARVGRFMNMGLLQEVPSLTPDIGKQDEENEASAQRGEQRRDARAAAATANLDASGLAKVPHDDALAQILARPPRPADVIVPIGETDFQIILTYPKVAPAQADIVLASVDDYVYLTFLPLDAAPAPAGGAPQRSSFYAAPRPRDPAVADHTINFEAGAGAAHFYAFDQTKWVRHDVAPGKVSLPTWINWSATLDYDQTSEGAGGQPIEKVGLATMENLFFSAFRTTANRPEDVVDADPYMEPTARPLIEVVDTPIRRLSENTQQQYDRQERGYNLNMAQDPADRRCHEARDFLIQKFVSDLFELAADGRVPDRVHVLHTGLTLLVPRALAETLSSTPDLATITKRVATRPEGAQSRPCGVFNPPHLMFSARPPRFSHVVCRFEDNRARLDWDLSWDHSVEPEHFVQHYELTRWIEVDNIDVGASARITFKRADKVAAEPDGAHRTVQRGEWQFTDEFEDMGAADRAKLFNPVADVVLRYTVVPVCVSGTRGRPCSDFFVARTGAPQLAPIKRASLIMEVDPIPHGGNGDVLAPPVLRLRIEAGNDLLPPGDELRWRILARAETILPSGQYGSDGHTERALGSAIGAMRTERLGDQWFDLDGWDADRQKDSDDGHVAINAMAPGLVALLQDTANPQAYTIMLQSVVLRPCVATDKGPVPLRQIASSALALAELGVEIIPAKSNGPDAPRKVMIRVEALELVRAPLPGEAYLLDPVAHVDVYARAGRAVLREPAGAGLGDLRYQAVLHPDFGGVTQLSWNVRPSALVLDATAPYRLLSGFDVYALDLDRGVQASDAVAWAAAGKPVASARLLSAAQARLTPSEVGEPSNWKVRYPSQAARRRSGGAWYSPAESRIVWPRIDVRREPLPEPSSELIKTLLRDGIPSFIEVGMEGGTGIEWEVSIPPDDKALWRSSPNKAARLAFKGEAGDIRGAATALRQQLRRLRAVPKEGAWPQNGFTLEQLRGWSLVLTGRILASDGTDVELTTDKVPMHFDRELHPLLEAIMARMRRWPVNSERSTERLLDVDRRPAPVLDARSVGAFMDVTAPALDPYGWAMLDRLGLGVTVRLFDPFDDGFLSSAELHAQLARALADPQLAQLYPEAMKHLFVEQLLQPGGMMDVADFSRLPDRLGIVPQGDDGAGLHDNSGLSMVRLSVRPLIRKELQYQVWTGSSAGADEVSLLDFDYYLPLLNESGRVTALTLKQFLTELENRGMDNAAGRKHFAQPVFLRGKSFLPGPPEDNAPGGELDAFGRFPDWKYDADPSVQCFATALVNALGPDREKSDGEMDAIVTRWASINARFFEYAAVPGSAAPVQYALAAVEPSDQMQVAPDSAGQVTIRLPESDGYAHHRAFAVLPQWRYARLLGEAGHTQVDDLLQEKRARAIVQTGQPNCYAIAAIERTAPIQPPEVLAVGRLGDRVWWREGTLLEAESRERSAVFLRKAGFQRIGTDPGNALPVVMRHHPELLLSKSNITPARGLALVGSLTSFVLTPSDQAWCAHFLDLTTLEPVHRDDGQWQAGPGPEVLDEVTRMLGQVPTGARIRVLRHLPHWYRHAIAVSAGAGRAVAETASAYLAEPPARLVEIIDGAPRVVPAHPWGDMLADGAIAPMQVHLSGTPPHPCFGIALPALRYRDTTDALTAKLWAGPVADLPDPGVCYDVALESAATALRLHETSMPLARITRGALRQDGDALAVFPLSQDWQVACMLERDAAAGVRELRLTFTPMSEPVLVAGLETVLAGYPYLRAGVLRVPGGWNAQWIDDVLAHIASQTPEPLAAANMLWNALTSANLGMADAGLQPFAQFPAYGVATFELAQPTAPAEWQALAAALESWLGALAAAGGALATLLHARFTPLAAAISQNSWPAGDPFAQPLPWLDSLPAPPAECGFRAPASLRMLVPELMTDPQFVDLMAHIGNSNSPQAVRFTALRQRQRERAMAGAALRIRATRGDAIPLELALISLT